MPGAVVANLAITNGTLTVHRGLVDGQEVSILRDTGCTMVGVKEKFVSLEQRCPEVVKCKTLSGKLEKLGTAEVHIQSPFLNGTVKACLIPNSAIADVIIGNVAGVPACLCTTPTSVNCNVCTRAQSKVKCVKPLQVSQTVVSDSPEEFISQQKNDKSLQSCFQKARSPQEGQIAFEVRNDVLYRVRTTSRETSKQVVLPMKYRKDALRLAHDVPMSGHMGVKRTKARVQTEFYWPGMYKDINRFVKTCDICQKTAHKGHTHNVPFQPMTIVEKPFQKMAIDLVGPLQKSDRGHQYILTVTDVATRWPEAIPMKEITTEHVAEALVGVFSRVGVPEQILSDRGPQFVSEVSDHVFRLLGISRVNSSPYHPQSNGQCERLNGTLKQMLRKVSTNRPREWDRLLPSILFAYRELPQDTLKFSPFELVYGRTARGPMSILKDLYIRRDLEEEVKSAYQYVTDLEQRIVDAVHVAQGHYQLSAAESQERSAQKTVMRTLKVGDKVLIFLPLTKNKLLMQWKGPYEVVGVSGQVNYHILIKGKVKVFHINMLRKYEERVESDSVGVSANVAVVEEQESSQELEVQIPVLKQSESFQDCAVNSALSEGQKEQLKTLLTEFQEVLTDLPGKTDLEEHVIRLSTERPIYKKQYPLPFQSEEAIKKEVQSLLDLGVLEYSDSAYASPIVLVKKKDGGVRMCLDFRALNNESVLDREPIPNQEELFTRLSKAKIFSRTDLSKGYHQIAMREDCKQYTAFQTPLGLMHYRYMPFGLVNAPATFARMMRKLLRGIDSTVSYFDDILIYTVTWEEHLKVLRQVLSALKRHGLTAKPSKTVIGFEEIDFLGHIVRAGEQRPQQDKVDKILSLSQPSTKKQVQSLLGMLGYYRKFIPNFATLSFPLTELTKDGKSSKIQWSPQCDEALKQIQKCFSNSPILILPDLNDMFTIRCDASDTGIGAVLLQWRDGLLRPCAFASRKLLERERRYPIIEREGLAIVFAVKKFQRYLHFSRFIIETDHKPLQCMQAKKTTNSRIMRWALALQQFSFTIRAIPGKENVHADALSRLSSKAFH